MLITHFGQKFKNPPPKCPSRVASININCAQQDVTKKTFYDKEDELLDIILENDFDIIGVSECDNVWLV